MNRTTEFAMLMPIFLAISMIAGLRLHAKAVQPNQENPETARFFDQTHDALTTALELFDDQQQLPANDELAFYDWFSSTKESQQRKVDAYLDVAAQSLGISQINERRAKIARLRKQIAASHSDISRFERLKISAPDRSYNPLTVSRSGYDKKIERERASIQRAETTIAAEKAKLVDELKLIGMTISDEHVDVLLESITGDEFVRISIIFDNARNFARELERLTEQSGEDLETAKKYYGVYLMLLNTVDRLQLKFIERVDDEYFPQLEEYMKQARSNIVDARKAIKQGGDRKILEGNIYNNEVTLDAASFYRESLNRQKYEMRKANEKIQRNILTATNTYKTASLSKDIASLISVSRRAFDSITSLSVPDLRPFENEKLKEEFSRMAWEIQSSR